MSGRPCCCQPLALRWSKSVFTWSNKSKHPPIMVGTAFSLTIRPLGGGLIRIWLATARVGPGELLPTLTAEHIAPVGLRYEGMADGAEGHVVQLETQ